MNWTPQSERDSFIRDAQASLGKSPSERLAIFIDLMASIESILRRLPLEERVRRADIARSLDPLPDPWWKNLRPETTAEVRCTVSSK